MNLTVKDFFPDERNATPDYATVTAILTNPPRVRLQLDGAAQPGQKSYRYLGNYAPVIGDRVLIQRTSGTIIVHNKVGN